jgi:hypothetical protein
MSAALQVVPATRELSGSVIPRIMCALPPDKKGRIWLSIGTGTWIGPNLLMTADHVIHGATVCIAELSKATVLREYGSLDVAFLTASNPGGSYAPISCDGVKPGEAYETSGYADGDGYRRTAIWMGLDGRVVDAPPPFGGLSRFEGLVREGMSGSPIWQRDTGRIVAIVNAGNEEPPHDVWGRSLADTYPCTGRA